MVVQNLMIRVQLALNYFYLPLNKLKFNTQLQSQLTHIISLWLSKVHLYFTISNKQLIKKRTSVNLT